ncbi:MAG: metal ABC transporter permease, partial [Solirubrobacterales bacterium]
MRQIGLALDSPLTVFEPAFAQRALLAVLCVAVIAGALGSTIVLRDLPFFVHAIGAGAYPALVLAIAWGVSLALAGPVGALIFAGLLWSATRGSATVDGRGRDTRTGILVARSLAVGAILTAVAGSSSGLQETLPPHALLFGSVLAVGTGPLTTVALAAGGAAIASYAFGARWLAAGFDPGAARQLGGARLDAVLLVTVALAVAAALPVTGSLMAGSLLVIPAATARMISNRAPRLTAATLSIAMLEGVLGLYLSLVFDLPPGATIAAVAGGAFLLAATTLWASRRLPAAGGRRSAQAIT